MTVPQALGRKAPLTVQAQIEALGPWFHNLHLPDGEQTAPEQPYGDFPAFKWRQIAPHLPADLTGWRVLDVGCNAGFYSFALAARGARVTAIDVEPHYLRQARWAAQVYGVGDRVEFRQMHLYELVRDASSYDLVWFMGVLYHLRHPLLALDILRSKTRRLLVLQTMTMPGEPPRPAPADLRMVERERLGDPGWPRMAFIEHRVAGDPSNWWAPDRACVEALLRSSGFRVEGCIAHETWLCAPDPDDPGGIHSMVEAELHAATGT